MFRLGTSRHLKLGYDGADWQWAHACLFGIWCSCMKLNNGDHATSLPLQQDMRRHRPSRVYEGRCQSRRLNIGSALDLRRINLAFRSRTDSAL